MSQYPPPPPSYGAYDQPPPPGFGYPPNQGPYYPQPGYPPQPTTCPPAPGGYYPGQPATQTIEEDQPDSSPKEKEILNQETNSDQAETEKHESRRVTPLYKKQNYKPTLHTYGSDRYKSSSSKQHHEKQESVTLYFEKNTRKRFTAEDRDKLRQVARRDHSDAESTSVEHKLVAQERYHNDVELISEKHKLLDQEGGHSNVEPVNEKHKLVARGGGYSDVESVNEKHELVARGGGCRDVESVNEKHKLVARDEGYSDDESTSEKHKLVARDGGYSDDESISEKHKMVACKRGYSDVELAEEKNTLVAQDRGYSDVNPTSVKHKLVTRKRGYSDDESANEKHRLVARNRGYSGVESSEKHKLVAPGGSYSDVESTTEEHKLVAQEKGHSDVESTVLESETDHLQHDENDSKNCKPSVPEHPVELKLSSAELKNNTFNSENSEKFLVAENMHKSKIPTFQRHKHQRFPKTVLGKNNEMHRLLDTHYRNPQYRFQPQFRLNDNYQPKENGSYYQRNITSKLTPYRKNDEPYEPDGSKDDNHKRSECYEETCLKENCHIKNQECTSTAVVEPEYRMNLLPKVLINNRQAETSNKGSYRVITSQPTAFNWNESDGSDRYEDNRYNDEQKVSSAPIEEVIYRNYVPQKVLNYKAPPADSKNNTQRVITAEPIAPNRHGECECFASDNCCENGCCMGDCCSGDCCEDNCCKKKCCSCCKQGCCKQGCCEQGCCKDNCFNNCNCETDICSDCISDVCTCFCDCIGKCLVGFCDCCGEACDCDDDC